MAEIVVGTGHETGIEEEEEEGILGSVKINKRLRLLDKRQKIGRALVDDEER